LHLNNYGHKFTLSKSATSPFLDLKEKRGPGEILKDISVKQYKEVYRKYKKLSEIGKVEIIQFEYNDLNKTLSELGDMLEIHRRQWPSAYKAPDFHNNLVSYGLKSGIMHFTALKVNDYTISWRICFIFRKRYYSYMPAMRQEYRQYSPGKYHQFFCIDYAYRNEFEIFDFLRGSEKYKGLFTNESEIIGGFESKNSSMQSMFKNTIVGIKNRLL
jgi:CelD/BcsL family acetyltransferase involved in cellulose biosynthesis